MLKTDNFSARHIGVDAEQMEIMLKTLGVDSLDQLIEQTIPASILSKKPFKLPPALDETRLAKLTRDIARQNTTSIALIGQGYYNSHTPTVIRRNVLENPDWYTAYTPYQPEVSQGRLEVLLNFQQMIVDLTAMELANASLLDEATAAAEAMTLCKRVGRKNQSNVFFVDHNCWQQTIAVMQTRAQPLGLELVVGDVQDIDQLELFGALMQYPNAHGVITDYSQTIDSLHQKNALAVVAADPMALALLKPPGEMGADVVVGSSQRFGVPMGFGGPHAAYFATREKYKRQVPGRLIGVSIDAQGKPAYRMALQTREQHIRRDKATSNICTSQVLLAIMATLYAMYHGPEGLKRIAGNINLRARVLRDGLESLGYRVVHHDFFDTLVVAAPGHTLNIHQLAEKSHYIMHHIDDDHIGISIDETVTNRMLRKLVKVFAQAVGKPYKAPEFSTQSTPSIPHELKRVSSFLTESCFHEYRSETEFMRFLRRTARKDITLARAMIPLGSCTMKLNAASQMEIITMHRFANIHPFAPQMHVTGYHCIIDELEAILCELTGFSAFSFQPNAGSQGEYSGLLCIRAWQQSIGQQHRDVCLIPSSAHGTNPASAVMAGLRVVVVDCDQKGNIDLDDLRHKADLHRDRLAAMMVTYPSTHGVFEASIRQLCEIVHEYGGQVYMDGANMNAMVGLCRPAEIGADVAHLNLHKTFAIPHGGGGPGVGPIGVRDHLAPFLPNHPLVHCNRGGAQPIGTVAAAPWGSPLILPISWAYLRLLGKGGLQSSTKVAILNANYIAARLDPHYPVVYRGNDGRVAHECIIDCSAFKDSGVSVDDIAKRLIDYGFHAPTMSWPVPDSLMIEPTESESLRELDRFCDALISIRAEIQAIIDGAADANDNLLHNAPHSYQLLVNDDWQRPYSRAQAFFPNQDCRDNKYWPPVGRVDNVYGDRHLVCTCPPLDAYKT